MSETNHEIDDFCLNRLAEVVRKRAKTFYVTGFQLSHKDDKIALQAASLLIAQNDLYNHSIMILYT